MLNYLSLLRAKWCLLFCLGLGLASAGYGQSAGGTVVGWGSNLYGQTVPPGGLTNAVAVACGFYHSLALRSDGRVTSWGYGSLYGVTNVPTSLTSASAVAAGAYHSLALRSNGTVVVWGDSSYNLSSIPAAATNVSTIAAGWYHNLALSSNGTVLAWGAGTIQATSPYFGQCMVPTNLAGVMAIAAGGYHSLALRTNGTVVAWGWNAAGQTNVPAGLSNVVAIAAGASNSLALKSDGTVVAWGSSSYGQAEVPAGLSNIVALAAGTAHNLVLENDGTLVAWGLNADSQTNIPCGLSNVMAIAAGSSHSLALVNMGPITFLTQPRGQTIYKGDEASFTPALLGAAPLSYQWVHNGMAVAEGTDASLVITNAQLADAGSYQLMASNAFGMVPSASAVLTVNDCAPYFLVQPASQFVWPPSDATLSVVAGGVPPLNYQWQFKGADLPGATSNVLTIGHASAADAGSYQVVVSNLYGRNTSSVAVLTVALPPSIVAQPVSQTAWLGSNATFSVTAGGTGPFNYQWRLNGTNLLASIITTVAGGGDAAHDVDRVQATNAVLRAPFGAALDRDGNLYVADTSSHRIRRIDTNGFITTVAGKGTAGFSGDGAAATNASLNTPRGVSVDAWGNLYVADTANHRIRKVNTNGVITTVAGTGSAGYNGEGGAATGGTLSSPYGVIPNSAGEFYILDYGNNRVRRVDTNGIMTTFAGSGGTGYYGDGGAATRAYLNGPAGGAFDTCGNLYIADSFNNRIRRVATNGIITTVAGNGLSGYFGDDDLAMLAMLSNPTGVALDSAGNLYLADSGNYRIREVCTDGKIRRVAGIGGYSDFSGDGGLATSARLSSPSGVVVDTVGCVYVVDRYNARVRKLAGASTLTVSNVALGAAGNYTVVVTGPLGSVTSSVAALTLEGPPTVLAQPASQTVLGGSPATFQVTVGGTAPLSYAWYCNGTNPVAGGTDALLGLDQVTANDAGPYTVVVTNLYGSVTSTVAQLTVALPPTICAQPTVPPTVLVGDTVSLGVAVTGIGPFSYQWQCNGTNLPNNIITTVAGTGATGFSGDGGAATNAQLNYPYGTVFDARGNWYIADFYNNRVRKVDTNGIITTAAAGFYGPGGLAIDAVGNIYVADYFNNQVRKIGTNGVVSTVAGNGSYGFTGDGDKAVSASLAKPQSVAVDARGNVFIADDYNNRIRRVDTNGIIITVAGGGTGGDGGAATLAQLANPSGLTLDAAGNMYIADWISSRVLKVDAAGIITTVTSLMAPSAVTLDAVGNLYISSAFPNRISRVDTNGIITTVAGGGSGGDGGAATNASLASSRGLSFDRAGNLYICDTFNSRVRKVALAGSPTRVLNNVNPASAGDYSVVVTSPWGSVTSSVVTLTVLIRPSIAATVPHADGSVTLNCAGTPNSTNRVWVTTNLEPPVTWWAVSTNVAGADGTWQFTDTDAAGSPARFYRVSMP